MDPFTALKLAGTLKRAIDTKLLKDRVRKIEYSVDQIGQHLANEFESDLLTGFECMDVAYKAQNLDLRRSELSNARYGFSNMRIKASRSPDLLKKHGNSPDLICAVAHAGEYFCLMLLDEPKLAYIQAYSSTALFPRLGADLFPPELFSRDFSKEFVNLEKAHTDAIEAQQKKLLAHRVEMVEYREVMRKSLAGATGEWGLKIAAATGVGIGSALACCVYPGYVGVALHNVRSAFERDYFSSRESFPTKPHRPSIIVEMADTEKLQRELVQDSQNRRRILEGDPSRGVRVQRQ
jgi:hypothetical protein